MDLNTLTSTNFNRKNVLLRVGFDLPIGENGKPQDKRRVISSLATIKHLLVHNAAQITIITHWGRPKKVEEKWKVEPIAKVLFDILRDFKFIDSGKIKIEKSKADSPVFETQYILSPQVRMLENLRFDEGEEKNDPKFAKLLSNGQDIFVNDAFSVVHREHASIVGVPKLLPSVAGSQIILEVKKLSGLRDKPEQPFVVIMGGAKVEDKLPVAKALMKKAQVVLIGGKTANECEIDDDCRELEKLVLPVDGVDRKGRNVQFNEKEVRDNPPFDIGPETINIFKHKLKDAKTIYWNGNLGMTEDKKFVHGTYEIARFIARRRVEKFASGGDTSAVIDQMGLSDSFSFISTGGSAASEFLVNPELPGLKVLERKK